MRRGAGGVFIGTSGWRYRHWRGAFYPPGLPQVRELAYAAAHFRSLEINGTFYSLTRPAACVRWRAQVPPGFVFAVKGSRYITHMLKLTKPEVPLANFFASGLLALGPHLGPFLWQLPPTLAYDQGRAEAFLAALPRTIAGVAAWAQDHDARLEGRAITAPSDDDDETRPVRHALEVRHDSWLTDAALGTLARHDVALVASDTAGTYPSSWARTASFSYLRLHGAAALYQGSYGDRDLAAWAERVAERRAAGHDVFVFFDNDAEAHAPRDALRLRALVEGRGARAWSGDGASA